MKRILVCLLAVLMLVGCGNKPAASTEKNLEAIYEKMEPYFPKMEPFNSVLMNDFLGIKADLYEEAVVYVCSSGLQPDEVWLIKSPNTENLNTLKQIAENRVEKQKADFQSINADHCAVLDQAVIKVDGDYLIFIVSKDVDKLVDMF